MAILLGALLAIGVVVLISLFNLCVLSYLWTWYITPVFNIPTPEMHYLYGLSLIVAYFTTSSSKEKEISDILIGALTKGVVILTLGWLVHIIF